MPTDFSQSSAKALKYAISFAKEFGGKIVVLHVVEPAGSNQRKAGSPMTRHRTKSQIMSGKELELEELRRFRIPSRFKPEAILQVGKAYDAIIEVAKAQDVDLIIMSTHGFSGLKHLLIGSVAERVVRQAPCPVLVVRDKELAGFDVVSHRLVVRKKEHHFPTRKESADI